MLKKIYDFFLFAISISERVKNHDQAIHDIERDFGELLIVVRDLGKDIQRLRDEQEHMRKDQAREYENLLLRLENEMLKFERRLSPSQNHEE
jgi:hypothetical protein